LVASRILKKKGDSCWSEGIKGIGCTVRDGSDESVTEGGKERACEVHCAVEEEVSAKKESDGDWMAETQAVTHHTV
jgi:hypothetical protein